MTAHHVFESIRIKDATNFPDFNVELTDGLNVFVGSTGSGKTSLADMFRFVVGADVPSSEKERTRFEMQVAGTLGRGVVSAVVRTKHGERYRFERRAGASTSIFRLADQADTVGTELVGLLMTGELFDSEHYGPGELNSLAMNPAGQLALIDRFVVADVQRTTEALARLLRRIQLNDTELTRLARKLAEEAETIAHLPEKQEALAALERADGPGADEIVHAHEAKATRGRERTAVAEIERSLARTRDDFGALASTATMRIGAAVDASFESGPRGDVFRGIHTAARGASGAVDEATSRLCEAIVAAENVVADGARTLAELHAGEDAVYQALLARQNEDKERTLARARLQKECEELLHAKKREAEHRAEHDAKRSEHAALLDEWSRLHVERYQARKGAVTWIGANLPPYLAVDVACQSDRSGYHALLLELLEGSNTRKELIENIAARIAPIDLADAVVRGDLERIMRVDEMKGGAKSDRAQKIVDWLRESGRLCEIETVTLSDVPLIALKLEDEVQPSGAVSTGQQATCILAVSLLRIAGPLVLDQPEDQLDNHFVFNVFVQQLIKLKEDRQFIVISHNPNVPMLANPSRIFILGARGRITYIVKVGTPSEVAKELEALMEGGSIAFLARAERYGHELVTKKDDEK